MIPELVDLFRFVVDDATARLRGEPKRVKPRRPRKRRAVMKSLSGNKVAARLLDASENPDSAAPPCEPDAIVEAPVLELPPDLEELEQPYAPEPEPEPETEADAAVHGAGAGDELERDRQRHRSRRKREVRARTVGVRNLTQRELAIGAALYPEAVEHPTTRADCLDTIRPCPFVSCKHHLYLDVTKNGSIKLNFPDLEVEQLATCCVLDVAALGEVTLERTAELMNITRERVRQIEQHALVKVGRLVRRDDVL